MDNKENEPPKIDEGSKNGKNQKNQKKSKQQQQKQVVKVKATEAYYVPPGGSVVLGATPNPQAQAQAQQAVALRPLKPPIIENGKGGTPGICMSYFKFRDLIINAVTAGRTHWSVDAIVRFLVINYNVGDLSMEHLSMMVKPVVCEVYRCCCCESGDDQHNHHHDDEDNGGRYCHTTDCFKTPLPPPPAPPAHPSYYNNPDQGGGSNPQPSTTAASSSRRRRTRRSKQAISA